MYKYYFNLTPSNPKNNINYLNYESLIKNCVEEINKGIAFKRDKKFLKILDLEKDSIKVCLHCTTPLEHSSRSLSAFTRSLSNYEPFKSNKYNKTLFTMNLIKQESYIVNNEINKKELVYDFLNFLYEYTPTNKLEKDFYYKNLLEIQKILNSFKK